MTERLSINLRSGLRLGLAAAAGLALAAAALPAAALTAGATYTVVLSKVNGDGTVTDVSSTSATADANGRITFALSNVPTTAQANFVVLTVKDASGNVVRKGISPAPPSGSSSLVGVNSLATAQAKAVLKALALAGSDDPVLAAFAMVLVRAPGLASQNVDDTSTDLYKLASGLKDAITGTGGFVSYMQANGATASQLATFRSRIVHNAASGTRDLGDYVAKFKDAVDTQATQGSAAADDLMSEAGAFLADILIDAADAAGIDLALVQGAFNAAGDVVDTTSIVNISQGVMKGMEAAIMGFFQRLAAMRLSREYTDAITLLGGSSQHAATYANAVASMAAAFTNVDKTYGDYWMDPDTYAATYLANNGGSLTDLDGDGDVDVDDAHMAIQQAIGQAFDNAWQAFQQAIRATNADVTAMRQDIAAALGVPESSLPPEVGRDEDWSNPGTQVNWAIPKVVAFSFAASHLAAGGTLTYTRGTEPIPSSMTWLDPDGDGNAGPRSDFVAQGIPPAFAALLGIEEDMAILTYRRWDQCRSAADPYQCDKLALKDFTQALGALAGRIGGVGFDEAKALVRLMQEPNL
ncbi:MAG TPA: hypothetical protein ENK20_03005 [Chromatiales bacterium]|nr:hypothetical protein [Chromatiales bacterium]